MNDNDTIFNVMIDNKIEKFKYIKMGIRDYKNNIFGKFEK